MVLGLSCFKVLLNSFFFLVEKIDPRFVYLVSDRDLVERVEILVKNRVEVADLPTHKELRKKLILGHLPIR